MRGMTIANFFFFFYTEFSFTSTTLRNRCFIEFKKYKIGGTFHRVSEIFSNSATCTKPKNYSIKKENDHICPLLCQSFFWESILFNKSLCSLHKGIISLLEFKKTTSQKSLFLPSRKTACCNLHITPDITYLTISLKTSVNLPDQCNGTDVFPKPIHSLWVK